MNAQPPPLPNQHKKPESSDVGMRMLLPVGRSPFAIAAGYLGLFSILVFPAPFALIFGILGIWDIRKSRQTDKKKYGMGRAVFGLVMGVLGTLMILAGIITMFIG